MTGVLTGRGDGHGKAEAEIWAMCPPAQEQQEPPEAGRCRQDPLVEPTGTSISDFWPPEQEENQFLLFLSHLVCGNLLQHPQETNTSVLYILNIYPLPPRTNLQPLRVI